MRSNTLPGLSPSTQLHLTPGSSNHADAPPTPFGNYETPSSSVQASSSTRPLSSFAFSPRTRGTGPTDLGTLDWLDNMLEGTAVGSVGSYQYNPNPHFSSSTNGDYTFPTQFVSDQAHLLALESPENLAASSSNSSITPGHISNLIHQVRKEPQLEDVTSWANISHFISLFLQYLYPLLPLVHRPTFAQHLATRRDLRDTDFRALLLSIGEFWYSGGGGGWIIFVVAFKHLLT